MIRLDNVSYAYPDGTEVLKNVTFNVDDGECVGLIGANGAGKSTLFSAALGIINAIGTIEIDGIHLEKKNLSEIRRRAGLILQDSDEQMFMPTVFEDLIFGPMNYGMGRAEAEAKAANVLESLEISYLKDRPNHKISVGEKKMTAIACALAMEPKVIFMDEPSASLDPKNRRQLIKILNNLKLTKVIASHDLDLVAQVCTRVVLLDRGEVTAVGKTAEILENEKLLLEHGL